MRTYGSVLKALLGKRMGLWRVFMVLLEAAHLGAVQSLPMYCLALVCRLAQVVRQAALSGGSWENAALFLPFDDPGTCRSSREASSKSEPSPRIGRRWEP